MSEIETGYSELTTSIDHKFFTIQICDALLNFHSDGDVTLVRAYDRADGKLLVPWDVERDLALTRACLLC